MISALPPTRKPARWAGALVLALTVLFGTGAGAAALPDAALCRAAIAGIEPDSHLPAGLLMAIGTVESGRFDPATRVVGPWPWTIDVGGAGALFGAAAEAIMAVRSAQAAGTQSIDVGCMQINLFYHPHAFESLEEAFDPVANVRYAARFLAALHAQTGDWAAAVAAYHSATPELGAAYAQRVAAIWPAAAKFGLTPQWLMAANPSVAALDPKHVFTPTFRAWLADAAAARCRLEGALCLTPSAVPAAFGARPGAAARVWSVAQAEAEVDPKHVMTPEFRAKMVAALMQRRQQQASPAAKPPPDRALQEYARR